MPHQLVQRIESFFSKEGGCLGRHINHDLRSVDYDIEKVLPRQFSQVAVRSQIWKRWVAAYDQGSLGSCTGNAVAGLLMTDPFFGTEKRAFTEQDAIAIYSLATQLDPFSGQYPPDDTGSDGLDAMKAAHKMGYLFAYYHIFDFQILTRYLSWVGPVVIGCNWYDSFDAPSSSGLVTISPNAQVRGGHEFEIMGLDPAAKTIRCVNSWGTGWGDHGCFQIGWNDVERLLSEQGDLTVGIKNR